MRINVREVRGWVCNVNAEKDEQQDSMIKWELGVLERRESCALSRFGSKDAALFIEEKRAKKDSAFY